MGGTSYTLTNTKGRLSHTSAAGGTAITINSYESTGRVQDYWQCTPSNCSSASIWKTHYNYDLGGDVSSWTHPAGFTVTNTVTDAQRISQISSSLSDSTHPATLATITYASHGAINTLLNGCVGTGCTQRQETYDYNKRLQPVRIQLGTATNPSANSCLVYNYYGGANPTSCAIPAAGTSGNNGNVMGYYYQDTTNPSLGHTANYSYDQLNRLMTAAATPLPGGSLAYNLAFYDPSTGSGYDRYGNMTCVTNASTNGPCPNWSFNTTTNRLSTSGFVYDAAGNLSQDASVTPTNTYQWDAEGRLTTVLQGSSTYLTNTHNAFGQVVEAAYPGFNSKVEGLFDPMGQELGYYNGVGNSWWDRDLWVAGHMIAQSYPNATYFLHANALHSDTQLTDQSGAVTLDLLYYPWGQIWKYTGSLVDAHFAGFEQGAGSFYTTPTRRYANTQGRWLSPDPLGGSIFNPQSLNRYGYVGNNPTSLIDPLGLQGHSRGCSTFWDCVHVVFCGSLYCGYNTGSPDPFDLQLFTACNGEGCSTGLDFNGATIANGLGTQQPPTEPPFRPPANNFTLGVRAPNQTFKQCMQQNANTYSIGGSVELAADVAFNKNTSISSYTSAVTGNSINTFFFGSSSDAAAGMAADSPSLVSTAMGSATTFGRRTSTIMSLNLAGTAGGPPLALSRASGGVQAALGKVGNVLSLGMSFATRTAVDVGFTAAEAINCSVPQVP